MNPLFWKHRPDPHPIDMDPDDWENNALSNGLAWASELFIPTWCKTPDHWTSKVSNYFWADCACCLFWRGVAVSAIPWITVGVIVGVLVW